MCIYWHVIYVRAIDLRFALIHSPFGTHTHTHSLDAAKDISESRSFTCTFIYPIDSLGFHFISSSVRMFAICYRYTQQTSFLLPPPPPPCAPSLIISILIFIIIFALVVVRCSSIPLFVCLCVMRFDNNRLMFNEITSQTFDKHTHADIHIYLDGKND